MPRIVFTAEEIAVHLLQQMRDASAEILALADLKQKPLDPGESPDARYHRIAKLGKQLAVTCTQINILISRAADAAVDDLAPEVTIEPGQAN